MHVIEIVTIIAALCVASALFYIFRPIIVFIAVLVWELFWKALVPLLALPFHAALAVRRRRRTSADTAAGENPTSGDPANAEREWMAQAGARVDAALAREPTAVTVMNPAPPERNEWR